jgi:hypothetical protein
MRPDESLHDGDRNPLVQGRSHVNGVRALRDRLVALTRRT